LQKHHFGMIVRLAEGRWLSQQCGTADPDDNTSGHHTGSPADDVALACA
jgi:hypothetical protein